MAEFIAYPILQSLRDQCKARNGEVILFSHQPPAQPQRLSAQFQMNLCECLTVGTLTPTTLGLTSLQSLDRFTKHFVAPNAKCTLNQSKHTLKFRRRDHQSPFSVCLHLLKLSEAKHSLPDHTPSRLWFGAFNCRRKFPTSSDPEADQTHSMALFTPLQLLLEKSDDEQRMLVLLNSQR